MKKIFAYLTVALFAGAFMTGCGSFLDIENHGSMGSVETFYSTDEEVMQAVSMEYNGLRNQYFYWFMIKNLLSDDDWTGGGSRGDQVLMERINEYHFDTDISYLTSLYTNFYTTIYYANLVLDNVEPDTAVKRQAIAEAHVIRAINHFELVTLYETAPIVDHVLAVDEYHQPNSTKEATWAFVEEDLLTAINSGDLPSKTGLNDTETGIRLTKELAQALLGKAYIFQGKYSQGAAMLDNVINSGLYALYTGDYVDLMKPAGDNCCEQLFQIQYRDDANNAQWSNVWIYCGWRLNKFTISGWAAENIGAGNVYGFCNPKIGLVEKFQEWEGEDGYRYNSVIAYVPDLEEIGLVQGSAEPLYGCEGYLYYKFMPLTESRVGQVSANVGYVYTNLPYMRYAEVLLLAAEAYYQTGNTAKADEYMNMVRVRAGETEMSGVTMEDIKTEKRLELCMEMLRWQDLVRWGDAKDVLKDQGEYVPQYYNNGTVDHTYHNDEYGFIEGKHNRLPIPYNEMMVNDQMVQNPGW